MNRKIKCCADMVFRIVYNDGEDVGSANAFVMRVWHYRLSPDSPGEENWIGQGWLTPDSSAAVPDLASQWLINGRGEESKCIC